MDCEINVCMFRLYQDFNNVIKKKVLINRNLDLQYFSKNYLLARLSL